MPSLSHQMATLERPNGALAEAKGAPLSVRIAPGRPKSMKARSNTNTQLANVKTPGEPFIVLHAHPRGPEFWLGQLDEAIACAESPLEAKIGLASTRPVLFEDPVHPAHVEGAKVVPANAKPSGRGRATTIRTHLSRDRCPY